VRLGWADLQPVDCGDEFLLLQPLFSSFFFFLTVAVGEVVVMGKDWLAREVCGGEKL
jgi:hypothetical protein